MLNQRWKGKLYLWGVSCLFCSSLFGQVTDTTSYHKLSDVEVIGHRKPSVLKSSAPIQMLNNRSFEQLGLQDLSDAVKRFSGVSVQDYGGIGGLKTVSVRSLGATSSPEKPTVSSVSRFPSPYPGLFIDGRSIQDTSP